MIYKLNKRVTTEVAETITFDLPEGEIAKMLEERLRTDLQHYKSLEGFKCEIEFVCASGPFFDGAMVKFTRTTRDEKEDT